MILGCPRPAAPACACDPRHLEVGGYDPDCPIHDRSLTDA